MSEGVPSSSTEGGYATFADVEERVSRLHREAREAQAQLDAVLAGVPAIIWRWDPDALCTFVNDAWETVLGRDPAEALGSGWSESVHPDDRELFRERCGVPMEAGKPFAAEYRIRRGDGSYALVNDQGRPTEDGESGAYVGAALEVSSQRDAEVRLRASNAMLSAVAEGMGVGLGVKDRTGRYLLLNEVMAQILSSTVDEVRGRTDEEMGRPGWQGLVAEDREIIETGEPLRAERVVDVGGTTRTFLAHKSPLRGADGTIEGIIIVSADVTPEHLRRSRAERLEALAGTLAGSRSLDEVADTVLVQALDALGAPHGALGLPNEDGITLSLERERGFEPKRGRWRSLDIEDESPPSFSFRTGSPLFFADAMELTETFPSLQGATMPYGARASLPLLGREGPIGVLYIAYDEPGAFDPDTIDFFLRTADLVARALERAMLFDAAARVAAERQVLLQISADLSGATSLDEVRRVAATAARDAVDADACLVGIVDPRAGELQYGAEAYPNELLPLLPTSLEAGASPAGDAVTLRESQVFGTSEEILARYPGLGDLLEHLPFESRVFVPITGSKAPVGVLIASCVAVDRFGAGEVRLLEAIGRQCGQALQRVRLLEDEFKTRGELERALSRLSRLQSVTTSLGQAVDSTGVASVVLEATIEALQGVGGGVYLADEHVLRRVAASGIRVEPAYAEIDTRDADTRLSICDAFRSGNVVWVPNREEWSRRFPEGAAQFEGKANSIIAIPFVLEERVLGAMAIVFEKEGKLSRAERKLARTIGEQAAQAFERARLYDAERSRVARTERLRRVAADLAAAISIDEVAEVLASSGARAVGAQAGIVVLEDQGEVTVAASNGIPDGVLVAIRSTPLDATLPGNDAIRGRRPMFLRTPDEIRERYPNLDPSGPHLAESSWATLPLLVRGEAIGAFHLTYAEPQSFGVEQLGELTTLVGEAASAMGRAIDYAQEREASIVLQESLLPRDTGQAWHGVELVTRYWAGTDHLEVGGDWYDVIPLPDGRLGVAVGDVVGRGLRAAAAMGQLRSALRGLALEGRGPARALEGLDRFASISPGTELSTVVYGELDVSSGEFRYACAGHPPPAICVDGRTETLDAGRSPLLAAGHTGRRPEDVAHLSPGSLVVLYTDGLVERRGETFDEGVARLLEAMADTEDLDLEAFSDRVARSVLRGSAQDDDVAFLCFRVSRPGETFSITFQAEAVSLGALRAGLDGWLVARAVPRPEIDDIKLAVHEAAANAVEHGYRQGSSGPVSVHAHHRGGSLSVIVRDQGSWREGHRDRGRGRGLGLMRALMDEVDVLRGVAGTTVTMRRSVSVPEAHGGLAAR